MILLDTNIFIYLANGTIPVKGIDNNDIAYASITRIEALGYSDITVAEQNFLEALFDECEQLDLEKPIIENAINLRQHVKLTLGDAIIAATALVSDCVLWTANEKDFAHIDSLQIHNPLNK